MSSDAFPESHYPRQTCPNKKGVLLPDGYGCFHAANLATDWTQQEDDSPRRFRFQYRHGNEMGRLEASEPTLPLFRPQEGSHITPPSFHDLARMTTDIKRRLIIQDRAVDQAVYFYNKFPRLIWGSALDFLPDSYVDQTFGQNQRKDHKSQKLNARNPIISLGKIKSIGKLSKLKNFLEPVLYDVHPNMLLSLLKEDIKDSIHRQYVDPDFYGGCLAYQPLQPSSGYEGLLIYPTGPTLETLNIHALPHQEVPIYSIKTSPSQHFAVASPLRQVETVSLPYRESVLAGVRTDYSCCIIQLTTKKNKIKGKVTNVIRSQQKIASIALSPFLFGECLLGLSTGGIQLAQPNREPECIQPTPELANQSPRWCHYGGHPRHVVSLQRKSLELIDCRALADRSTCCLLSLPCEDLPQNQDIFVAKQHPSNPFYHFVATQNLLILLDERFPQYNVLQWSHSLSTPPSYLDIVPQAVTSGDLTSDLIVLGSQCSREVHCFQCSTLNGQTPESTSLPWKIGSTDGWFNMLPEYPATNLDPVRSRLERPLIGVSAAGRMSHQGCEPGVTVFQLSSAGDVYFQTYSQKTDNCRRDKTLSSGPGCPAVNLSAESLTNCKEWIEGVFREANETKQGQTAIGSKKMDAGLAMKTVTWMTSPNKACQFCNSRSSESPCLDSSGLAKRLADDGGILRKRPEDGEDEDALPGRINPRGYPDKMSKALHHAWVHGYDAEVDEEDEGKDSPDQSLIITKISPLRPRHMARTPELFTPSQKSRPQGEEANTSTGKTVMARRSLDMTEQPGAADSSRMSTLRSSQTNRSKRARRSAMGF